MHIYDIYIDTHIHIMQVIRKILDIYITYIYASAWVTSVLTPYSIVCSFCQMCIPTYTHIYIINIIYTLYIYTKITYRYIHGKIDIEREFDR